MKNNVDIMSRLAESSGEDSELVNTAAIDAVFRELQGMEVELDDNPLIYGPKRLQGKIAQVRNMQTRVQRIYQMVSQVDHAVKRAMHAIEAEIRVRMDDMFSSDPEVKVLPSIKDREAQCNRKLRKEIRERSKYEAALLETEGVLQVIRVKQRDLRDVVSRLKDQVRLCQDEIALGGAWGSKNPDADDTPLDGGVSGDAASEMEDFVNGIIGTRGPDAMKVEVPLPTVTNTPPIAPPSGGATKIIAASPDTRADDALEALDLDSVSDPVTSFVPTVSDPVPQSFWDEM